MRLATWNVNSLTARMPRVTEWIQQQQPDVLCMQETKQADDKFPEEAFAELGYESAHHGDGRWNGVAIVSKVGLEDVTRGFGTSDDDAGTRIVVGGLRGNPRLLGLRSQRSLSRQRDVRGQVGLARPPAGHARRDVPAGFVRGRVWRLQRRARRR